MTSESYHTYPIFLSSLCKELKPLREKIFYETGHGELVYVDEEINKERNIQGQDDLLVADELIKRLREADVFVCIFGGTRHGTSIKVNSVKSAVSFFEIELFQAALLEKEIFMLVRDNFEPEPRLRDLLTMLQETFPGWVNAKRLSDGQILSFVKNLVENRQRKIIAWPLSMFFSKIRMLVQGLDKLRAVDNFPSKLLFLNERFETRNAPLNENILYSLNEQIESIPTMEQQLSRLWIGIRELMTKDFSSLNDPWILGLWNKFLGQWANAGAWYGLHGDTPLGCLAALNTMAEVRSKLSMHFKDRFAEEEIVYPGGALASATYSIAKRLYIPNRRKKRLNEAMGYVDSSLKNTVVDNSGLHAIRGSIFRQLGHINEAVSEYELMRDIRIKNNASDPAVGEALSELGFGYLRQGRLFKGLNYCKDGVRLLRNGPDSGFVARSLRKLSVAYLVTGNLPKARETWLECKRISSKLRAFDQM